VLNEQQLRRYDRNILLKGVGIEGQEKLLNSKVLVVGAGGLGSPAAFYLAAAGIGTLGLIDADTVDYSNLQRQILHSTGDLGRPKVASAAEKLKNLNPDVRVITYQEKLNGDNYLDIIKEYQAVVDGTDNFPARFLINDACVRYGIAYMYGGVLGFVGQAMTIVPGTSPCLRCVFPKEPDNKAPTCREEGILGAVPGVIGSILATEAVKYLLGLGELLTGKILTCDALSMHFFSIDVERNPECHACSRGKEMRT